LDFTWYECPKEKTPGYAFVFVKVMESLEHALNREVPFLAETYLGGAITWDAHHMTDPHSDGLGVSSCIEKSLEDAGVYKHNDFSSSNFLLEGHILSTGGAAFRTSSRRPVNTAGFSN